MAIAFGTGRLCDRDSQKMTSPLALLAGSVIALLLASVTAATTNTMAVAIGVH